MSILIRNLLLLVIIFHSSNAFASLAIKANSANISDVQNKAIYLGDVTAVDGLNNLWADRLEIEHSTSELKATKIIALGNPAKLKVVSPDKSKLTRGAAMKIIYYPDSNFLDLIGKASVSCDSRTLSGENIRYNSATGVIMANENSHLTVKQEK